MQEYDLTPTRFVYWVQGTMAEIKFTQGLMHIDGSVFADTNNNQSSNSRNREILNIWGTYANIAEGSRQRALNQPWDVAVSKDGFVYVADTFNHRIGILTRKFHQDDRCICPRQQPDTLSLRGIAVDLNGNVLITDT